MTANTQKSVSRTFLAALLGTLLMASGCTAAAVPAQNVTNKAAQIVSETAEFIQEEKKHDVQTSEADEIEAQLAAIEAEAAAAPAAATAAPAPAPVKTGELVNEAAEMMEEVPAAAPAAQQAAPVDDGIWHIQYVSARDALSAPEDGSIGLWADGWFIAHSHMPNGDKIATFPPRVEVDGKIYRLADKWVAGDILTADEVARVRCHDGIVFQTCITDTTNWMVLYEPEGAGYGYQFAHYPYTVNDTKAFGYYPEDYATPAPVSIPVETGFQPFDE